MTIRIIIFHITEPCIDGSHQKNIYISSLTIQPNMQTLTFLSRMDTDMCRHGYICAHTYTDTHPHPHPHRHTNTHTHAPPPPPPPPHTHTQHTHTHTHTSPIPSSQGWACGPSAFHSEFILICVGLLLCF